MHARLAARSVSEEHELRTIEAFVPPWSSTAFQAPQRGQVAHAVALQGNTGAETDVDHAPGTLAGPCSPALDLEILARTLVWMARGRGWKWSVGLRPAQKPSERRRGSDLETP